MGAHWDATLRPVPDPPRPYDWQTVDDGDLYEQLIQQDDKDRHDQLAAYLRELTETLARVHMDGVA